MSTAHSSPTKTELLNGTIRAEIESTANGEEVPQSNGIREPELEAVAGGIQELHLADADLSLEASDGASSLVSNEVVAPEKYEPESRFQERKYDVDQVENQEQSSVSRNMEEAKLLNVNEFPNLLQVESTPTHVDDPEIKTDAELESNTNRAISASIAVAAGESSTVSSEEGKHLDDKKNSHNVQQTEEDNQSFTTGKLLQESKNEEDGQDTGSSPSQEKTQQYMEQNTATLNLINRAMGVDEEGRSRQRILSFAAKRYASAVETNPEDYDALFNWALVLQESAENVSPDSTSPSKDELLEEACDKYDKATQLCPTLHDAFYNWAIAISDRARLRGRTMEAEELWKQATKNYEKAVHLNWNSPQALNNWGLGLQELGAIVPARDKHNIMTTAISKFRAAISLQFDFHRAIYNLGTVLYALAEDVLRSGGVSKRIISTDELYSQSAIYIAAAHALKPNYSVYKSALRLVRSMLPLPYLKVGYLTAPPVGKSIAPHSEWKPSQFVLDQEVLQQVNNSERKSVMRSLSGRPAGDMLIGERRTIKIEVADIVSVSACADLALPAGAGLCITTIHALVYLVADSWECLHGWLDAIRLVYTIHARAKSSVLADVLTC